MNEIYNAAWYAEQEVTPWPFIYSPVSDDGKTLPDSIISDIKLIVRGISRLNITGVQVTESFVSVVISSDAGIVAACTVQQPIKPYRHYKLETFVDNAVGVIVFGHGARTEAGSWQFSSDNLLSQSAVVSLPGFPVLSLGKTTKLSGDITLAPGSDLIIEKVDVSLGRTISDGEEGKPDIELGSGYKLSLSTNAALRSTTVGTQSELLKAYAGPCAMRLTNNDCPYITSINGVFPDENGNINIKTSLSNPELKTITVTESGNYLYDEENNCKEPANESVFVLIGDTEEIDSQYIDGTFRRCGMDYCEVTDSGNHQEDFADAVIVNDGVTQGVRVNQATGLLEPSNGIRGKAAVKFSEDAKSYIEAVFRYHYYISAGEPSFGIIYNIRQDGNREIYDKFLFKTNRLFLGDTAQDFVVPYGVTVMLSLRYGAGIYTGKIVVVNDGGDFISEGTISCQGENKGGVGIYIEHCRCQSWSAL